MNPHNVVELHSLAPFALTVAPDVSILSLARGLAVENLVLVAEEGSRSARVAYRPGWTARGPVVPRPGLSRKALEAKLREIAEAACQAAAFIKLNPDRTSAEKDVRELLAQADSVIHFLRDALTPEAPAQAAPKEASCSAG